VVRFFRRHGAFCQVGRLILVKTAGAGPRLCGAA